jgi:hypothetical protein
MLTISPPSVSGLSAKCDSLDVSQFYGLPWTATATHLLFLYRFDYHHFLANP